MTPEPIQIDFDDNSLVPILFGAHNEHLARIEQKLGISVASRGNRVALAGPPSSIEAARCALTVLYDRLKRGMDVDLAEVDAAIRHAEHGTALHGAESALAAKAAFNETVVHTRRRRITPRTPQQAAYIAALNTHDLTFGLGPAGTGKTYIAAAVAVSALLAGSVEKIILSRPAVEAGERLGFLPGDLREKVDPYLRPLYDALYDMLPQDQVAKRLERGDIEIAPLAFMRGRTLSKAYIILDEAQNTTAMQMKMFLTRLGEGSRMAVTGDMSQVDLPAGVKSGLRDAIDTVEGVDGVACIRFTATDVVRHPLVARIVSAYDARGRAVAERRREEDQNG